MTQPAATLEPEKAVAKPPHGVGPANESIAPPRVSEDENLDDVIRQHMQRWLQRAPDGAAEVPRDEPPPATTPPVEPPLAASGPKITQREAGAQEPTPVRRERIPAPSVDLEVLRKLANENARRAIDTCRLERYVGQAQRLRIVALAAMAGSFALLPFCGPGSWFTPAAGLAAFLTANVWTIRYLVIVRRLTRAHLPMERPQPMVSSAVSVGQAAFPPPPVVAA